MKIARLFLFFCLALSLQMATAMSYEGNGTSLLARGETAQADPAQSDTHHAGPNHDAMMDGMEECCPKTRSETHNETRNEPCNEMPDCADMCAAAASCAGNTNLKPASNNDAVTNRTPSKTIFAPAALAARKDVLSDRHPKPPKA